MHTSIGVQNDSGTICWMSRGLFAGDLFWPPKRSCHLRRQHLQTWEINKSRPGQHIFQKRHLPKSIWRAPQQNTSTVWVTKSLVIQVVLYIGDDRLPSYIGILMRLIMICLYKDTTRIPMNQSVSWNLYQFQDTGAHHFGWFVNLWCDCDQFMNQSVFHWVMSWSMVSLMLLPGGLHEVR